MLVLLSNDKTKKYQSVCSRGNQDLKMYTFSDQHQARHEVNNCPAPPRHPPGTLPAAEIGSSQNRSGLVLNITSLYVVCPPEIKLPHVIVMPARGAPVSDWDPEAVESADCGVHRIHSGRLHKSVTSCRPTHNPGADCRLHFDDWPVASAQSRSRWIHHYLGWSTRKQWVVLIHDSRSANLQSKRYKIQCISGNQCRNSISVCLKSAQNISNRL